MVVDLLFQSVIASADPNTGALVPLISIDDPDIYDANIAISAYCPSSKTFLGNFIFQSSDTFIKHMHFRICMMSLPPR